jgi:tetraacyldisaccharide 4'-kinase
VKLLRKILLPFSLLYWGITRVRNIFYNNGTLKSWSFPLPVIAVGNLSTGGTGKTPQTEYLIRLLKDNYRVAVLSRGYKRKTQGYILADADATAHILGDEPYQFHKKFPGILVAVDANRKNGIENLMKFSPDVILLDDAYQHRRVKAGFYILLTAYGDLYPDDFVLPAGNLREGRSGAKRANIIIVTKCPPNLTEGEQENIINKLKPAKHQQVYFTFIEYDAEIYNSSQAISINEVKNQEKLLLAGIAKPQPFYKYLRQENDICKSYPDHHDFTEKDIDDLLKLSENRIIITTEKDYVRLAGRLPDNRLYYLPIKSSFIKDGNNFNQTILNYVGASTGNNKVYNK